MFQSVSFDKITAERPALKTPKTKLIVTNKTAYDILALRSNATQEEIRENYYGLITSLKTQKSLFNPGDYELKLEAINQAYDALATISSRAEYDARLAAGSPLVHRRPPPTVAAEPASLALRAEAISLRAEAISLRADALSIHSQIGDSNGTSHRSAGNQSLVGGMLPLFKKFAMLLGTAVAVWMVIQVASLMLGNRRVTTQPGAAAVAREKVVVQEYYQTNGVRPSSAVEAELLESVNRKRENEARNVERDKRRQAEDERRFESESRRRAAEVSAELRYSENQARDQARREDEQNEQKASRLEQQKQMSEDRERNRIEREKAKWENVLRR
jgi:curved DNA-binding protein CbpA